MINGKITETMLGLTDMGLTIQFAIGFKENKEVKNIVTGPINIRELSDIISIIRVIGTSTYEGIKNAAVQFEINDGKITKIANFCDSELEIALITEGDKATEKSIKEITDND